MSLDSGLQTLASTIGATTKTLFGGIGYWTIFADSSTTFPARTTKPAWWLGRVVYDSTEYLDHADPSDAATKDIHRARTS